MNLTMRYAAAGVVGLIVGGAIIYVWGPGQIKQAAEAKCPFAPAPGSAAYGFELADAGNSHFVLGTLYFTTTPGGFKHNIAILDPGNATAAQSYDVGPPCTTPASGGAQFAMINSSSGKPVQVGTVTFNSAPSVGSNATYGIGIAASVLPAPAMSGDAYLMN